MNKAHISGHISPVVSIIQIGVTGHCIKRNLHPLGCRFFRFYMKSGMVLSCVVSSTIFDDRAFAVAGIAFSAADTLNLIPCGAGDLCRPDYRHPIAGIELLQLAGASAGLGVDISGLSSFGPLAHRQVTLAEITGVSLALHRIFRLIPITRGADGSQNRVLRHHFHHRVFGACTLAQIQTRGGDEILHIGGR